MSDKSNQQISNLMDGELEVNASNFLLKRMAADASLSQTWENYHLIKSCLQKEQQEPLLIDVASQVCQQLGTQTPAAVAIKSQTNRWLKPLMGMGIAASVAFMSVFMLQNQQVVTVNKQPIIANNTTLNPIKPMITASTATASKILAPPPSLSRFPSISAKKSSQFNQGQIINMPYLIIIKQPAKTQHLSPMRIKNVSE